MSQLKYRPSLNLDEINFLIDAIGQYVVSHNESQETTLRGLAVLSKLQLFQTKIDLGMKASASIGRTKCEGMPFVVNSAESTDSPNTVQTTDSLSGETETTHEIAYKKYKLLGGTALTKVELELAIEEKAKRQEVLSVEEKSIFNKVMMSRLVG